VVAVDLQAINKQWNQIRHGVGRFRPWFELCRLPHSLAVAVDPLAGALVAGAGGAQMPYVICLMFGAFFLHAGAVVLNDWHDFKADRIEHPDRPMPAGQVGRWYGLFGAIVLLCVGWTFMSVPDARSGQLGMGVLAAALLYEFIMKGAPAGKAIPALTRALLLMMGAMLVPIEASPGGWPLRVFCMSVLAVYAIGAAILAERPEDQYRSAFAVAGGIVAALAVATLAMMRVFFPAVAVYPSAAAWIGLLIVLLSYPIFRAATRPSDAASASAAWVALLGSVLVAATMVAFVRNLAISLPVAAMVLPVIYTRRLLAAQADVETELPASIQDKPNGA